MANDAQLQQSVGRRIRLIAMPDDPDPLPAGSEGEIVLVQQIGWRPRSIQITVKWDSGRSLSLVVPPDRFEFINRGQPK